MMVQGNAQHLPLADGTVQCCVTSPPYWGLRDYGVAGQLGLESTPDAYVASMVAVFREVRRVLRDDGTLWLNLGDSYTSGGRDKWNAGDNFLQQHGVQHMMARQDTPVGLKPKDLVGIPWRVAFALQQPYYAGTIKNREDRIWLAAMLDAEGCMFIHKRKAGQHNGQGYYRQNDNYGPGLEIANTSIAVVERIMALVGKGSICSQGPEQTNGRRRQTIYRWNLRTIESRDFVRELYPHLIAKQHQARLLYGCPSSGPDAERSHAGLMALHRGDETSIDFPAPPSMFEPGWYLRSDVIWSKANPMPESVTDRPTKAHEYLFLLTKSARYYYDAAAIAEAGSENPTTKARNCRADLGMVGRRDLYGTPQGQSGAGGYERQEETTRNRRSVWTVNTQPYPEAHFATFPEKLVEPCILAGSKPGDLVLDPFAGSGTVGVVCRRYARRFVGIDLNGAYVQMAVRRLRETQPGLALEALA